jgi:fructose-1,6-bisphosphatase/inositol monophosphatase family enzyme
MEVTLDLLKSIALKIYKAVNPILGTKKAAEKLERGAGGDISMHIDVVAENIIINELKKNNIDILFISEEIGEQYIGDRQFILKNKYKLIVDPVDGSNNAVRGIPYSSASLAYAIGDRLEDVEMAVIINLYTRDLYWAIQGEGAYMNGNKIFVSDINITQKSFFEIDVSKKDLIKNLEIFKKISKYPLKIRIMGSTALTLCQIASGSVDGFLNLRETSRIVDAAAGYLILKEAGGRFFSINGTNLDQELLSIKTKFPFVASNSNLEPFLKESLSFTIN